VKFPSENQVTDAGAPAAGDATRVKGCRIYRILEDSIRLPAALGAFTMLRGREPAMGRQGPKRKWQLRDRCIGFSDFPSKIFDNHRIRPTLGTTRISETFKSVRRILDRWTKSTRFSPNPYCCTNPVFKHRHRSSYVQVEPFLAREKRDGSSDQSRCGRALPREPADRAAAEGSGPACSS
jgi:hypothetical protein